MLLKSLTKALLRCGFAGIAVTLAGCATPPPDTDPDAKAEYEQTNDPLEPTNRAIFDVNNTVDTYFMRPVAQGYRYVVPQFGRDRIADFLANLNTPLILANDLLQGNVSNAGKTLERFALNSSFGVLGIMDVAKPMGVPAHESDFGMTLGVWGIPDGPYLVLPFFGPSNPRDTTGMVVEFFADPLDIYLDNNHMKWLDWTRFGVTAVSEREAYLDYLDDVQRSSLDYYAALRSLYRQRRASLIEAAKHGGSAEKSPAGPSSP